MIPAELRNLRDPFESHVESYVGPYKPQGGKSTVHIARQHCIEPYEGHRTMLCGHHVKIETSRVATGDGRERWCRSCVNIRTLNGGEIR